MIDPRDVTLPNAKAAVRPLFQAIPKGKVQPLLRDMCLVEGAIGKALLLLIRVRDTVTLAGHNAQQLVADIDEFLGRTEPAEEPAAAPPTL